MKIHHFTRLLSKKSTIAIILLAAGIVVGIQTKAIHGYNNFVIYTASNYHITHWINLYTWHKSEYMDQFLYSPVFAVLIAPFAAAPLWMGLVLWSLVSCAFFYFSLTLLPDIGIGKKMAIFFITLIEFITCIQNNQTNAIIVSCMVLAFICFEKEKVFWAAFFIVFASCIKVFALAAAVLFLVYPRKGRFIIYMVFWGILFAIAPVTLIPGKQLAWQYQNWWHEMTLIHHSEDTGNPHNYHPPLSVMGWLKTWYQVDVPGLYIQLAGIVMLMASFLRARLYNNQKFRYFLLSSILIFTVIFNHIAESPSFVIAVYGAAIWFVWEKRNILAWALLVLMILFTVLSPTDIFPRSIREDYVIPYVFKAIPCILIWVYIQLRLWFGKFAAVNSHQSTVISQQLSVNNNEG